MSLKRRDIEKQTFVGKQIRKALKEKGLKNIDLCRMVGLSPSRLSNYLNSKRTPDFQLIAEIALALGKPLDYFSYPHTEHSEGNDDDLSRLAEIIRNTLKPVTVEVLTPIGVQRFELDNTKFVTMLLQHAEENVI